MTNDKADPYITGGKINCLSRCLHQYRNRTCEAHHYKKQCYGDDRKYNNAATYDSSNFFRSFFTKITGDQNRKRDGSEGLSS